MLQYRLSTLFMIFFVVAATLALFGVWGIWIAGVLLLAAICLNRSKRLMNGIILSVFLISGIVWFWWAAATAREAAFCRNCQLHLGAIAGGVYDYENHHKQFPPIYECDKDGKSLRSWLVEILPELDYSDIYNKLNKDEAWNSPHNARVLPHTINEYICPRVNRDEKDCSSNYLAIIGPGTIWKAEGSKKMSDLLPNGYDNAVVAVEVVDSGKHWAEPFALTVDEVLENMRTQKGIRISTCHPSGVNVLFADGSVCTFPAKMPLSLWRKILSGVNIDDLNFKIDSNAPDMVDVYVGTPNPKRWDIILGVIVWLFSVVLLFHRAMKSRKKPEIEPTSLTS